MATANDGRCKRDIQIRMVLGMERQDGILRARRAGTMSHCGKVPPRVQYGQHLDKAPWAFLSSRYGGRLQRIRGES